MNRPDSSALPSGSYRLSRVLDLACLLLAIAFPALLLYYLLMNPAEVVAQHVQLAPAALPPAFEPWQRAAVALLALIPAALTSLGLLRARQSFQAFVRGEYFSVQAVRGLRGFASCVMFSVIAGSLVHALIVLVLTTGAKQQQVALDLNSNQLLLLLFAGIVWQISTAMSKAAALAEENAQFV